MHVLTFVTSQPNADFDLWIKKSYPDIGIQDREILDMGKAVSWVVENEIDKLILDRIRKEFKIDIFQQNIDHRTKKLFMADMDSTIVSGETLDDMATLAGVGDEIAAITARAMRGELDFEQALRKRVGMLKNLPITIIEQAIDEMRLNAGAQQLLTHLKSSGIYCVLISGGFTQFTSVVADRLGFDQNLGNQLITDNGYLTGDVGTPILDKNFKAAKLKKLSTGMQLKSHETIAIGDGANDLDMLQNAGMGVGYYPKPLLQDALVNRIEYTDLSSLIYAIE
jgi:phosphoserine phosphatase